MPVEYEPPGPPQQEEPFTAIQRGTEQQSMSNAVYQYEVPVTRGTAARPVNGPGFPVPRGAVVEIVAISTNSQVCYVSTASADAAQYGPARMHFTASGVPRTVKVENLANVWVYSAVAGEGVLMAVKG